MPANLPTISACLVAFDQEERIGRTLSSIAPVVSQSIVIDLESADRTPSVADEMGAEVYSRSWDGDLGAARNLALSKATADWILVLEPGEEVARHELSMLHHLTIDESFCFEFLVRIYTNDSTLAFFNAAAGEYPECEFGYSGYVENHQVRLFPNGAGISYAEQGNALLEPSIHATGRHRIVRTRIPLHHYSLTEKADAAAPDAPSAAEREPEWQEKFDHGEQLRLTGRYQEAVETYLQAIQTQPRNTAGWLGLGQSFCRLKCYSEALDSYAAVVEIDPTHPEAFYQLGVVYQWTNNMPLAEQNFRKALELNPKYIAAYRQLGTTLTLQNRLAEAIQVYTNALTFLPESARIKANLGAAFLAARQYDNAERLLTEAVSNDPSLVSAYHNLSRLYRTLNKLDKAIHALDRYCEITEKRVQTSPSTELTETLKRVKIERELLRRRALVRQT